MPSGHGYLWTSGILTLHVGSDLFIALSYYSIAAALLYFVRRRSDVIDRPMLILVGIFILACGTTHILGVLTTWAPVYWFEGVIKGIAAIAAVMTAIAILRSIPHALDTSSLKESAATNEMLRSANLELEKKNADKSREILTINAQRDHLASIVSSSSDAIISLTPEGLVTFWNDGAREIYGFAAEEVLGHPIGDFVPVARRSALDINVGKVLSGASVMDEEAPRRTRDGRHLTVSQALSPIIDRSGQVVGISSIERDITARKSVETELRVTATELRRSNKELEEFAYVASHDLQAPLRTILSFGQLLIEDVGPNLTETAQSDLKYINDAAARMMTLVNDLLLYSKLGRASVVRRQMSLRACVDTALMALGEKLRTSGAKVTIDQLPQMVGNAAMLTQLFQNLIGNALKFSTVAPTIHVTCESTADGDVIGIKDNGIGIKPEFFDKVFVPFQRLHSRVDYEGSGIGLAICRKVVEIHDGRLWVESDYGHGAHFRFILKSGDISHGF